MHVNQGSHCLYPISQNSSMCVCVCGGVSEMTLLSQITHAKVACHVLGRHLEVAGNQLLKELRQKKLKLCAVWPGMWDVPGKGAGRSCGSPYLGGGVDTERHCCPRITLYRMACVCCALHQECLQQPESLVSY